MVYVHPVFCIRNGVCQGGIIYLIFFKWALNDFTLKLRLSVASI